MHKELKNISPVLYQLHRLACSFPGPDQGVLGSGITRSVWATPGDSCEKTEWTYVHPVYTKLVGGESSATAFSESFT